MAPSITPLECTEGPPLSSGDPPPRVVLTSGAFLPRLHSRGRGIFSTLQCRHPLQWATSCRRVASYEWKRVIVSLSATAMTHFWRLRISRNPEVVGLGGRPGVALLGHADSGCIAPS